LAELGDRVDALLSELAIWDGYLEGSQYLAGNTFSMADIAVMPFLAPLVEVLKLPLDKKFPRLGKWYAEVKARPSSAELTAFWGLASSPLFKKDHPVDILKDL
jgi:glutathione S-transferase